MKDLEAVFDTHVHAGPDVRQRRTTWFELAQAARAAGMRGLILKNHHSPTMLLASALAEALPGLAVHGGLVLNEWTGGLLPAAVDAALRLGAAQIWMPTLCAEQERAFRAKAGTGLRVVDSEGQLLEPVREILSLIAQYDAVLGTGHLAPEETLALVEAATAQGVRRILVTHPEINFLKMPVELQLHLCRPGLYFERCYAREGFALDWDGLARVIHTVGPRHTILASDLGQPENPHPVDGLRMMRDALLARGVPAEALFEMCCQAPARLLKLDG